MCSKAVVTEDTNNKEMCKVSLAIIIRITEKEIEEEKMQGGTTEAWEGDDMNLKSE